MPTTFRYAYSDAIANGTRVRVDGSGDVDTPVAVTLVSDGSTVAGSTVTIANGGLPPLLGSVQRVYLKQVDGGGAVVKLLGVAGGVDTAYVAPTPGGAALPSQTGQAGKVLGTNGTAAGWSSVGTIDTTNPPQPPSGAGNPGSGATGAAAADHVHPLTSSSVVPLWQSIDNGVCTLARGHSDDSGSYGSTPASGVEHFTFFRADKSKSVSTIRFQTGGTGPTGSTLARVGLYTVDPNTGALALVASCANKTSFAGTYAGQTCALTAAYSLVAGSTYAVGLLQVATTPASLLGAWFNGTYLGGTPKLAQTKSGQADLAAAPTGLGDQQFPVYYELV